jgi:hypothetical protein
MVQLLHAAPSHAAEASSLLMCRSAHVPSFGAAEQGSGQLH